MQLLLEFGLFQDAPATYPTQKPKFFNFTHLKGYHFTFYTHLLPALAIPSASTRL